MRSNSITESERGPGNEAVKNDRLRAIALMKRKQILKFLLKLVAMTISLSLLRFYFIPLTPTALALLQTRFDSQPSISCKFLFRSMQYAINESFDS